MRMQVQVGGIAWFEKSDYAAILKIMSDAHLLPSTFEQWKEKAESAERQFTAKGVRVVRAVIDPKTFPAWCKGHGLNVDAKARMAFANEEAARQAGAVR